MGRHVGLGTRPRFLSLFLVVLMTPPDDAPAAQSQFSGSRLITRRDLLIGTGVAATILATGRRIVLDTARSRTSGVRRLGQGQVRHSVAAWCFDREPGPLSVADLASASARLGLASVELVEPRDWSVLRSFDLTCALCPSHDLVRGWNHRENHEECKTRVIHAIEDSATFGCPNVITFSGLRHGITDEEGLRNMVDGLKQVVGLAERHRINICLEVLNSRIAEKGRGHPDYQADSLEWAIKVCDAVGSPRMKILFDVYHIQIMQGNVVRMIRAYADRIGHYQVAGVPGRGPAYDSRDVSYPAVIHAILDSEYGGFIGQEFIPVGPDKLGELLESATTCDL